MRLFDMHISCFQHQLVDDVDSIVTQNKLINCIFSEQNVSIERIALKLDDKNNYAESIIVPLIGQRSAYSRWFFSSCFIVDSYAIQHFSFPFYRIENSTSERVYHFGTVLFAFWCSFRIVFFSSFLFFFCYFCQSCSFALI